MVKTVMAFEFKGKMITQQEYFSCAKKNRFKDLKAAEKRIKAIRKTGQLGSGLNAYQCKYCGKYHIGHKNRIDRVFDKL